MTLKKQIAELTEEVRKLRAEVADLRCRPASVQFIPYVVAPVYQPAPFSPHWWADPPYFICESSNALTLPEQS